MTPLVSIVTGTYNRLPLLKSMVGSIRSNMLRGLAYEVIVVDGGSDDGTLEWVNAQPDIRLIAHGELRGAIKAFCDGARAARGQYVCLANDDISFRPWSILRAIVELETNPYCAQVCFADNRYSLIHGDGSEYRVEGVMATMPDGRRTMVPYGQVSLTRRELGEEAGWWGDQDPIMSGARTYAGDNYLSARLYEMGYTCNAVAGAEVQDFVHRDLLRETNGGSGPMDSALYYKRFPTVPIPAQRQQVELKNRLRMMTLPIYEHPHPQSLNREAGLTESLSKVGLCLEFDYVNSAWKWVDIVSAWQPDLLITQFQAADEQTLYDLATARNAVPNMVVVNWNGDVHEKQLVSPIMLDLLKNVDIQTVVNAKVLDTYKQAGIRAAYWQIGYRDPIGKLPDMPKHDVLWQGNCYNQRRNDMLATLKYACYSNKATFGVYGSCPGAVGNTHYDFAAQAALYKNATITVGDTYPGGYAYVSNRVFQALAAGAFLVQEVSPGLEEYTGLTAGVHYVAWKDHDELARHIRYWLNPKHAAEREKIAQCGQQFVREHFSYDAQVRKLFADILPMLEDPNADPH